MKIMIINNMIFPESIGGTERFVEKQADELVRKGEEVIVVSGSRQNKREYYQNYKIIRFRPRNIYFIGDAAKHNVLLRTVWTMIDLFNIWSYLQLKKIIKRERPHQIICHNVKGLGYLTPDLIRLQHIKYIQYIHDVQLSVPSGILYPDKKLWHTNGRVQKVYANLVKQLVGSPDEVVSLSQWLLKYYTKQRYFIKSKTSVLPFDMDDFNKFDIQKKYNFFKLKISNKKDVQLLYVGKIEEYKGVFFLVNEMKKLPHNIYIQFVGSGNEVERLKKEISNFTNMEYIGQKSKEELKDYYQKADMLIMPTLCYENRPQVIVEAYTEGLPVIASSLGGIPEIVIDGETGILFSINNADSFKKIFT